MRVALLTHQWPGIRMGGIGTATRQTAAALAAAGHDVHIFTVTIPKDLHSSIPKGVHFHESPDLATRAQQHPHAEFGASATTRILPNREIAHTHSIATIDTAGEGAYRLAIASLLSDALLKEHAEQPFEIIEAPEVDALALPLMLRSDFNAPIVTHLHCCTALAHQANQSPPDSAQSLTTALEFAAIHLADRICAPTRAVVTSTQQLTPIPHSVEILPHPYACDNTPFSPPPTTGPIIFIGRIERLKGVTTIAQALNLFLPNHPAATFRFIGPDTPTAPAGGSMQQHLQSQLSPEIANRVHFTGELSANQIQQQLQSASFVVQPSLSENFSMTCCEALAAGRTIIVGQQTGSVELIGDAGPTIDQHNPQALAIAMEQLWTNRPLLQQLSKQAHCHIRNEFAPARIAARLAAFYKQTLNDFQQNHRTNLAERLTNLPPTVVAAVLPAFSTLIASLAGLAPPSPSPGHRLLKIMDQLSASTNTPAKVLLYGAGKFTTRLLAQRAIWESKSHQVTGLIDDHPRFRENPTYLDLPVHSLKSIAEKLAQNHSLPPIILSTDTYQDQFWSQTKYLRAQGVRVIRLFER